MERSCTNFFIHGLMLGNTSAGEWVRMTHECHVRFSEMTRGNYLDLLTKDMVSEEELFYYIVKARKV